MCQRWKPFYDSSHCNVELVLKANNIEVNNQHAAANFIIKDVQTEFEDFWSNYKQDPLAGKLKKIAILLPPSQLLIPLLLLIIPQLLLMIVI